MARYVVEITGTADRALQRLTRGQPRDATRIEDTTKALADDPRPAGCTALTGAAGGWRNRVGNYRICYQIEDDKLLVLVLIVGTRDDVYQRLRRMLG